MDSRDLHSVLHSISMDKEEKKFYNIIRYTVKTTLHQKLLRYKCIIIQGYSLAQYKCTLITSYNGMVKTEAEHFFFFFLFSIHEMKNK